jgi:hypothetical protein
MGQGEKGDAFDIDRGALLFSRAPLSVHRMNLHPTPTPLTGIVRSFGVDVRGAGSFTWWYWGTPEEVYALA